MKLEATEVQLAASVTKTPPDILKRYQESRNWQFFPKEWIYRNIDLKNKEVLDFGCGTGEITTQLALLGAKKVYGLDVTPGLLEVTRRRAELDGVANRVETMCGFVQDVESHPVDVVIAFAVLHHCFPLENVIPPLLRWLKPGGTFVAVEPVVHISWIEWLRDHSGVEGDPKDEGERKLNPKDLRYILGQLNEPKMIPFHLLGRLARVYPPGDMTFRRFDQTVFRLPMTWKLSGTALISGKRKF